jgi:hypothetical protein
VRGKEWNATVLKYIIYRSFCLTTVTHESKDQGCSGKSSSLARSNSNQNSTPPSTLAAPKPLLSYSCYGAHHGKAKAGAAICPCSGLVHLVKAGKIWSRASSGMCLPEFNTLYEPFDRLRSRLFLEAGFHSLVQGIGPVIGQHLLLRIISAFTNIESSKTSSG